MQKHLVKLLMLLTILVSCQSSLKFQRHERKLIKIERCRYEEDFNGSLIFLCHVDCTSHTYDLNIPGRITGSVYQDDPTRCTNTVGFDVNAWETDITPTIKALKEAYK